MQGETVRGDECWEKERVLGWVGCGQEEEGRADIGEERVGR